ncbi:hypothetical protein LR48_Vigan01g071600 [Vigna angularis]|uniref:Uncharacterized protein n=1 Tax=Phaseolus angularis TaxID=3914 RepID=A0A0L9TL06_PHAAN|nr:hypothetical protein LR48_Vigan01g071600 [Vigna angularis]
MQGKYYLDLVRVFYFNLKVRDGVYSTRVKGVDIVLDDDMWTTVAHIQLREDMVMLSQDLEGFNKIMDFRSFLKDPKAYINNKQLLCSEADVMIIYGIINDILIHSPNLIFNTMMKAKMFPYYPLSYALLVSRICEYKGVDVSREVFQSTHNGKSNWGFFPPPDGIHLASLSSFVKIQRRWSSFVKHSNEVLIPCGLQGK